MSFRQKYAMNKIKIHKVKSSLLGALSSYWPLVFSLISPMLQVAAHKMNRREIEWSECPICHKEQSFRLIPDSNGMGVCQHCGVFKDGILLLSGIFPEQKKSDLRINLMRWVMHGAEAWRPSLLGPKAYAENLWETADSEIEGFSLWMQKWLARYGVSASTEDSCLVVRSSMDLFRTGNGGSSFENVVLIPVADIEAAEGVAVIRHFPSKGETRLLSWEAIDQHLGWIYDDPEQKKCCVGVTWKDGIAAFGLSEMPSFAALGLSHLLMQDQSMLELSHKYESIFIVQGWTPNLQEDRLALREKVDEWKKRGIAVDIVALPFVPEPLMVHGHNPESPVTWGDALHADSDETQKAWREYGPVRTPMFDHAALIDEI